MTASPVGSPSVPAAVPHSRRFKTLFLALGGAGLVALLVGIGWQPLATGLAGVGAWFAVVILLQLASLLLDAFALRLCAGEAGRNLPYRPFARASITGHAINTVTPFGQLGEVTKYTQLGGTLPPDAAAGALLLQNLMLFASATFVVAFGLPWATLVLPTSLALTTVLLITSTVFAVALGVTLWLMYRGPGPRLFALAHRFALRWKRATTAVSFLQRADHLSRNAALASGRMTATWALTLVSRGLGTAETAVILHALSPSVMRGPTEWLALALLTQAGGQVIAWATSFVPLQTGTAEGGAYLLFAGVGLPPETGVLLELVRKGRRLVFAGLGLAMLAA